MTPSELTHAGRTLYGPRWQSELSRTLGVSRNLVGMWARGERPIAEWVPKALRDIGGRKLIEWQEIAEGRR